MSVIRAKSPDSNAKNDSTGSAKKVPSRWYDTLLLVLLLSGFGFLYASTLDTYSMLRWDEAEYASLGRSILRGEPYAVGAEPELLRPPLGPGLIAMGFALQGGEASDRTARRVAWAWSLLGIGATFVVGGLLLSKDVALTAAVLLGLMPEYWARTSLLMMEIPFMALFGCALAFFAIAVRGTPRWFYLAALFAAAAVHVRYTGALFLPIAGIYLLLSLWAPPGPIRMASRSALRSKELRFSILFGGLLMVPWLVRQQIVHGDALAGFKEASTQLQRYLPELSIPFWYYLQELPGIVGWPIFVLVLIGLLAVLYERDGRMLYPIGVVAFLVLWFSLYRFKEPRQIHAALPFLALIAAFGGRTALRSLEVPWIRVVALFIAAPLLLYTSISAVQQRTAYRVLGSPVLIEAAQELARDTNDSEVIMAAPVPQVAWYADRKVVPFPSEGEFDRSLRGVSWVLSTNFERSQPPYVVGRVRSALVQMKTDGSTEKRDLPRGFRRGGDSAISLRPELFQQDVSIDQPDSR